MKRNADILDLQPPVKEFLVTAYSSTNKAVSINVNTYINSKVRTPKGKLKMGNGYELGRDKERDRDEGVSGNLVLRILKIT